MKMKLGLVALGLALGAAGAFAQTTWKISCINSGSGAAETVGEGHVFWVSSAVCTEEGGPLGGAVATQNAIWENVKGTGTLLSGDGVGRSPRGVTAYRNNAGTMKMLMQDGKVVGWEATGAGVFTLATGPAAAFKGKAFSWTAKSTGHRTYTIESKLD